MMKFQLSEKTMQIIEEDTSLSKRDFETLSHDEIKKRIETKIGKKLKLGWLRLK